MLLHHLAQLRDGFHRRPVHRQDHVAGLNTGIRRMAYCVFNDQTGRQPGLGPFRRRERPQRQAELGGPRGAPLGR